VLCLCEFFGFGKEVPFKRCRCLCFYVFVKDE